VKSPIARILALLAWLIAVVIAVYLLQRADRLAVGLLGGAVVGVLAGSVAMLLVVLALSRRQRPAPTVEGEWRVLPPGDRR
jgi:hypothetical protein